MQSNKVKAPNDAVDDGKEDEKDNNDRDAKSKKEPSKYTDIGVHFSCKSALLTLSFHVKTDEVIKLYLYHNGQCMRFMPEDIKTILPTLFNLKYADNEGWLNRKDPDSDELEVDRYINEMKKYLKDVEFDAFRQSYM